jgi:MFS family permease
LYKDLEGNFLSAVLLLWVGPLCPCILPNTLRSLSKTVTVGAAMQTAAQGIGMFIAGRVIGGLAAGLLLSTVPIYNAEIAVARYRGLVVGLFGAMASFGVLCSNWVGYACQFTSGNAQWRIPLACQMPGSVLLFAGSFFLSESPRWRRCLDSLRPDSKIGSADTLS